MSGPRNHREGEGVAAQAVVPDLPARPSRASGPVGTFASLAIPQFRLLWLGTLFSLAAVNMDIVARAWLAYNISDSAFILGLVLLARGLPQLVFSLVGGVVADRFEKRKVLIFTQSSLGLLALINAIIVHVGIVQIWHLVALGALQGIVFPLTLPARQAYIPELVGRKHLSNALALVSTGQNLNRVLAPGIAGMLIAWDPAVSFYAIALFYVSAALTVWRLPSSEGPARTDKGAISEIVGGFRYIWARPALRVLMLLAFLPAVLGLPYQQLLPVFQSNVLHVGPAELGLMYAFAGVGSLLGSLLVARFSEHPRRGVFQMGGGVCFGLMLCAFALSTTYQSSVALLFLAGLAGQAYLVLNNVLLMLNTDRKMYAQVLGIYMMTWSIGPVIMLPLGALADSFGAPATMAVMGITMSALIALVAVLYPEQWRMVKRPAR